MSSTETIPKKKRRYVSKERKRQLDLLLEKSQMNGEHIPQFDDFAIIVPQTGETLAQVLARND